jgi:hypothetical protein
MPQIDLMAADNPPQKADKRSAFLHGIFARHLPHLGGAV